METETLPIVPARAAVGWRIAALLVVVLAMPVLLSDYRLSQVTSILIMAVAVLGLNILVGYSGQLSLGHGAIFALGAYTSATLITHAAIPWWATLPATAVVCFLFGFLFGWPALRLKGHYLALATFALALATPQLLKHRSLEAWTGGVQGILLNRPAAPAGWPVSQDRWLYGCAVLFAAVMFVLAWNILRGRIGRATLAIREHAVAAEAMGVNVALVKTMTFGLSALYTGLAGAMSAIATGFVSPDSFSMFVSIFLLVAVVVGGLGTIPGALVGAIFIQIVPNIADQISKSAPSAVYGLLLIVCVYVMPRGFVGLVQRWQGRRAR